MNRRALLSATVLFTLAAAALSLGVADASAKSLTWKSKGKLPSIGGSADSVSCPSPQLCVVVAGNNVFSTTAPNGSATAWKRVKVNPEQDSLGFIIMTEVECPAVDLCVVTDNRSNAFTTTTPNGDAIAWSKRHLPTNVYTGTTALACASTVLCAALDYGGLAMGTTAPGGTWNATVINKSLASLYEIGCTSFLCAAVEADKRVWISTAPAAVAATWSPVKLTKRRNRLNTVTCAGERFCVAAGDGGTIRVAKNAKARKGAWKAVTVSQAKDGVFHAYCKSPRLCFLSTGPKLLVSKKAAKSSSWKTAISRKSANFSDISCATPSFCVAIEIGGKVWLGKR
jgi:hypothetical protein